MSRNRRRAAIVWATIGGIVVVGALAAILIAALGGCGPQQSPSPPNSPGASPSTSVSLPASGHAVDPSVANRGWVPEPITSDQDAYAKAALEAVGSFDTRKATRTEWLAWLDTWFTPSPLYEKPQDAVDQMAGYQAELDQSVVLPQDMWDSLTSEDGRVTAHVKGDISYLDLPDTSAQHMWTASADLIMHYTRTADGQEVSYDETVRVSVQVVCGGKSVPTPGSAQRPGDCKVVRYFDQAVG